MSKRVTMSIKTRKNWLVDLSVFLGGVLAGLSGVYFLFLPSGGYQGGRNAMYGITILFERHTWSTIHAWGGILMIAAVAIHLTMHWHWVRLMGRKVRNMLRTRQRQMSNGARINLAINVAIATNFALCALSGIYFLFAPAGGFQGGHNPGWDPGFLLSRTTWDLVHAWSGIVLIVASVLHFEIHWRWISKVTARFFLSLIPHQAEVDPRVKQPTAARG